MGWKFEVFKKRKMGIKGVPFGYLEFSRAIREKPCPRAPPAVWRRSRSLSPGSGSDSLPGLVLFEPGLTGMGYSGSRPLHYPDLRNGWQETAANRLERSVATVQTDPLQPFGRLYPFRSAINSASFFHLKNTATKTETNPFFYNSNSKVKK